jgi:hypothetical protein
MDRMDRMLVRYPANLDGSCKRILTAEGAEEHRGKACYHEKREKHERKA